MTDTVAVDRPLARLWRSLLNSRARRYLPALLASVPLVPTLGSVLTVLVYILWRSEFALLIGSSTALAAWLILALASLGSASKEQANVRTFHDFRLRLNQLDERIRWPDSKPSEALATDLEYDAMSSAWSSRKSIEKEMTKADQRWVRGHGYNNLWIALHAAEEALIETESDVEATREGLDDESRLSGSEIPQKEKLLDRLRSALGVLNSAAHRYFLDRAPADAPGTAPDQDKQLAKAVLRDVRHAINQFNDSRYDGLIRLRNSLRDMVAFGGLAAYILLGIAVLSRVQQKHIEAAAVFYLAGVFAGLLTLWYSEAKAEHTVQTFGLERARLLQTLVFSGAAAIAGVFLYRVAPAAIGVDVTPEADSTVPALSGIFDLNEEPSSFLMALVFGASPEALVSILKLKGDQYIDAVRSTGSGED